MTRVLIKLCLALALGLAASTAALAHAALDHAEPAVGSTVGSSPGQVVLYFTESIEAKFSGAEIRNASGAKVDKGSKASGNKITVSAGGLAAGTYMVKWHVLSVDTHKTQGSFKFTVGK
jgi:methionine-rich copper-binding protein CopC